MVNSGSRTGRFSLFGFDVESFRKDCSDMRSAHLVVAGVDLSFAPARYREVVLTENQWKLF